MQIIYLYSMCIIYILIYSIWGPQSNLVCVCKNWNSVSVQQQPTSPTFILSFFFAMKIFAYFDSLSIHLHAFQPWPYLLNHKSLFLSWVRPQLCHLHSTLHPLHTQQHRCCHAVYVFTLSSLCWLLACYLFFVSPFSFFMHSPTLRRSSAPPCQFQYVLPAHSCLAFHFVSCLIVLPLDPYSHSCTHFNS